MRRLMDTLKLERIPEDRSAQQMAAIHRVFVAAPDYCSRVIGEVPALSEMTNPPLPPGKSAADHYFFGIYLDDEMIGCADVLRGYPDQKTAYLGLVLLAESHQHRGLGAQAFAEVEKIVSSWREISAIRGAIVASNPIVIPFWEKMGFVDTGIRSPWRTDKVGSESLLFEKRLI
jgi:GNAT superfamily N-acetyltransferase